MAMPPPTLIYIPPELVEKVLLNLPFKSLSRFSTVSKSWNSTINSPDFSNRYRGREMIVMKPRSDPGAALVYPLSSILSRNPMADSRRRFIYPRVKASCGELWLVEFEGGSVCLYNPTMQTRRNLPASTSTTPVRWFSRFVTYGLGYDSATDDYKVLKFNRYLSGKSELYSQRSDSWRMLSGSSWREDMRACLSSPSHDHKDVAIQSENGVFVNGLLHWILRFISSECVSIVSFDLSTEKYGEVAVPESVAKPGRRRGSVLGVLRGKLCVYSDELGQRRGVLWVHDEGVWSKEFVMNYPNMKIKPLYSYSNNIKAFVVSNIPKIFLHHDESTQLLVKDFGCGVLDAFTYVESMRKP